MNYIILDRFLLDPDWHESLTRDEEDKIAVMKAIDELNARRFYRSFRDLSLFDVVSEMDSSITKKKMEKVLNELITDNVVVIEEEEQVRDFDDEARFGKN